MKYVTLVLIALLPFFCESSDSRKIYHASITSANYEWYRANEERVGLLLLEGTDIEAVPIVNTIGSTWKFRDGAIGIEIAPVLAESFTHRTHLTFLWFNNNPKAFDSWLDELPEALFTDYDGASSEHLEVVKRELQASLTAYINSQKNMELVGLANKLLNRVRGTEITVID